MSSPEISQVLAQMRTLATQLQSHSVSPIQAKESSSIDFASMLKMSIDSVNNTQQEAGKLAQAFETGEPGADIAQVMIALQKASISFQAMTQVRNKLVSAYQDIMSMPI